MPQSNVSGPPLPGSCHARKPDYPVDAPRDLGTEEVVQLSPLELVTLEVAHDLGNLLQVASSAIRIIDRSLDGVPRSKLDPIIYGALASIERASALSRRILDTGRPAPIGRSIVYLDSLLADMREEIALAAGPAIRLIFEFGDCIPAIACHRADLENVLLNLVANARDAMGTKGRLTLSVARSGPAGGAASGRPEVVLRVADTGCGMPPSVSARAFRPFFTTKAADRGTGLGLALVRAFVTRLGGSADIFSVVGKGTTVLLRLPSSGG